MGQFCCFGKAARKENKGDDEKVDAMNLRKKCVVLAKEQKTRLYILGRCIIFLLRCRPNNNE